MPANEQPDADATPDQQVRAAAEVLTRWASCQPGSEPVLDRATVRIAVGAAARLYSSAVESAGREIRPVDPDVATTDAVRLSVALLRSQGLTPFEMAMWFGESRQETPEELAAESRRAGAAQANPAGEAEEEARAKDAP